MAGPMPGLLTLMEELYGRINKERLFGGGVRGAATRGLLGAQPAEDMTPTQRDVYENAVRISAPAQGLTALKAATVFHGSPAKFKRFDPTKIGSGEGAQVYGYGHYVAENPSVAKTYKTAGQSKYDDVDAYAQHMVNTYASDPAKALKVLRKIIPPEGKTTVAGESRELIEGAIKSVESGSYKSASPGSLYKIDLPDEQIARMLDWDKPLSQQPENVREALQKFGVADNQKKLSEFDDALLSALMGSGPTTLPKQPLSQTGESFYKTLGNPSAASQRLREAGIPGIRYLDQGSRSKFSVQNLYKGQPYGEPVSFMTELQAKEYAAEQVKKGFDTKMLPGTSNFVVFPGEEELLRILERNGVPITSLLD